MTRTQARHWTNLFISSCTPKDAHRILCGENQEPDLDAVNRWMFSRGIGGWYFTDKCDKFCTDVVRTWVVLGAITYGMKLQSGGEQQPVYHLRDGRMVTQQIETITGMAGEPMEIILFCDVYGRQLSAGEVLALVSKEDASVIRATIYELSEANHAKSIAFCI